MPNPTHVRYSWEIISSTLTIFVSILVFRSIDGVFEYCLLGGSALSFRAAFYAVVSMAWIWILQVALYYSAGAQQRAAEAKAADLQPKADDASDQVPPPHNPLPPLQLGAGLQLVCTPLGALTAHPRRRRARVISFRVISFRVISFRVISFRVISFRVISTASIFLNFG